jgi:hypothetical protein
MTAIDRLIKDMQELKKTKVYASSFKCIDDCLFLAEYYKKEERNQIIRAINYSEMKHDELLKQAIKERKTLGEVYYDKIIKTK